MIHYFIDAALAIAIWRLNQQHKWHFHYIGDGLPRPWKRNLRRKSWLD